MQSNVLKKLSQSSASPLFYRTFLSLCLYAFGYILSFPCCFSQELNCPASQPELLLRSYPVPHSLSSADNKLPRAIQALLVAYKDSIKSAQRLDHAGGVLLFRNHLKHKWSLPRQTFDFQAWQALSEQQQIKLWQNLGFQNFEQVLNQATLAEQLLQVYPKQSPLPQSSLPKNFEPGRLRDEAFFKKIYGHSKSEVAKHLTTIRWGKKTLKVTRLHQIDQRLKAIYQDLKHCLPKRFKRYYEPSAGAFNWRTIKGTSRLSVHSFGAAIDIGVKYSNYWKWTLKVYGTDQKGLIPYKNNFPKAIVEIFERYGFIWGGWWYHHDTMHFEYRPELLVDIH